jgi:hypothetical protein
MKTGKTKLYELQDIDNKKTITYNRQEAQKAFERGFIVIERIIMKCYISVHEQSVTIVSKEWI